MTKDEFLKRCETIYDSGLARPEVLRLMNRWVDAVMRFEGGQRNEFQLHIWEQFIEDERRRTDGFANLKTLANDMDGYDIIKLVAILVHPCQACAESTEAWHTRPAFCEHRREGTT